MTSKEPIVILGAGPTGLSAAIHLKQPFKIFEAGERPGGMFRSVIEDGFVFDYVIHLIHLKDPKMEKFFLGLLGDNIRHFERKAHYYYQGILEKYPFQVNMYALPYALKKELLLGLIEAHYQKKKKPKNFKEWALQNFGLGISNHFLLPLNEKQYNIPLEELTTEWMGRFLPSTNISATLDGAFSTGSETVGYHAFFHYPLKGGSEAFVKALVNEIHQPIECNKKCQAIDLKKKEVTFADGSTQQYSQLITAIPLPVLVPMLKGAPKSIQEASKKLRWVSDLNVCVAVKGKQPVDSMWIYYPEKKFSFFRVVFGSTLSEYNAPPGHYTIWAEYSHPFDPHFDSKAAEKKVIADLHEAGLIDPNGEIVKVRSIDIPYAYVVYDKNWNSCTKKIHHFLEKNNIDSVGRFGRWEYSSTEESLKQGMEVAEKLNNSKK